jgi:Holliday junction DNA helicase RuvA subunit
MDALPAVGAEARVYLYLHHRDDQMKLYGFAQTSERVLFLELLKVDGIGPRQALRILSSTPPEMFLPILDAGDVEALSRTPGIGKKTAQKIVLTLRGKLRLEEHEASSSSDELVAALVEMGFERKQAVEAVDAQFSAHDVTIAKVARPSGTPRARWADIGLVGAVFVIATYHGLLLPGAITWGDWGYFVNAGAVRDYFPVPSLWSFATLGRDNILGAAG